MKKVPSGRFVLRLPPALHAALREKAAQLGLSLNDLCLGALSRELEPGRELGSADPGWLRAVHELLGDSLQGVLLFGSVARDESRSDSDIDLLVVVKPEVPLSRRLYSRWDESMTDDRHNPHFVHLPASAATAGSLWLEAAVDGIVLFDRDARIGRFLGRLRRGIASGKVRRGVAYGHPYWIRTEGGLAHAQ
jgi:predicted nucleotidyltransferase